MSDDRSLYEIIEAAKDGNKPSYEECYWAMLALASLHTFDSQDLLRIFEIADTKSDPSVFGIAFIAEEAFRRNKRSFEVSPRTYVGPNHDPANPEYQAMRKLANKVYDKVLKGK